MSNTTFTSFFPDSQGTTVLNSSFLHVQGDYYNLNTEGISTLKNAVAIDAFHDSAERSTSRCHPGTRGKVIDDILSWIKDGNETRKDILWIHGPAGSGKSTVMQSIAEICFNCTPERRHPGGTFFFSRGKPRRDTDRCLFTTLSYALLQSILPLRNMINHIMVADPAITSRDCISQLRRLVFEPLQQLTFEPSSTPFVIIDGLDECKGHRDQREILHSIQTALKNYGRHLRFIITTRSEAHIRETFESADFENITCALPLNVFFDPTEDIRLYIKQSFEEISRLNGLQAWAWFQPAHIDRLVEKSDGQFLFASTVVKHVGNDYHDPRKRLKLVLQPSPPSASIFRNIDGLYTQILETIPDSEKDNLREIMGLLLTMHCPQPPEVYDDILRLDPGYTTLILRGLHSVVRYPTTDDKKEKQVLERRLEYDKTRGLRFHHASFQDFLIEEERSKTFFVDMSNTHVSLVKRGFDMMKNWISSPWRDMSGDETNYPSKETWGYIKHHMVNHLTECDAETRESIVEDLLAFQLSFPPPTPIDNEIWDHAFDALHSMVTAIALVLDGEGKEQGPSNSEHSHWAQDRPFKPKVPTLERQDRFMEVYTKYSALLDGVYKFALSSSNNVLDFLDKVPGLVTDPLPIVYGWLESLFRIDREEISATMRQNGRFFHKWYNAFWDRHFNLNGGVSEGGEEVFKDVVLVLNPHFAQFLCDRRAGKFFWDPEQRNILDYSHITSMIFSPDWLEIPRTRNEVTHFDIILRECLKSISLSHLISPPPGHPIIALLDILKGLDYDLPCLQNAPVLNVDLLLSATRRLLHWIQTQHEATRTVLAKNKSESRRIRRTLAQISNKIYSQILQVHNLANGGKLIAVADPFLVSISREFASDSSSILSISPIETPGEGELIISETLLSLSGVRSSLLGFLTKPKRAGDMHVPSEVYHTQFAGICLKYCDPSLFATSSWDWRVLSSHREWQFHLTRASPSNYILDKLNTISFGPWLAEGKPTGDLEAKQTSIADIITWVEKIPVNSPEISESREQISMRWKQILSDLMNLDRRRTSRGEKASPSVNSPNSPDSTKASSPNQPNFNHGSQLRG